MMSGRDAPTRIGVYELLATGPHRVAEFRMTRDGHVALTMTDDLGSPQAEQWYDEGVEVDDGPNVLPSAGPDFMRALLQPFRMSYYRLVDESAITSDAATDPDTSPETRGGW